MITIVTDSTADFLGEVPANVKIVPLYVSFGEEEYLDGVTLSSDEFFEKLKKSKALPKTSQPNPEDFEEAYRKAGSDIISLHLSEKMSGTFQSAKTASQALSDVDIRVIDSRSFSMGLGVMVAKAARMAEAGEGLDAIEKEIRRMIPRFRLYGTLDTLSYLEKGGRIGKVAYFLGSRFQIKPIIYVKDGDIFPLTKVRKRAKALEKLVEKMSEHKGKMEKIAVIHTVAEAEAKEVAAKLKVLFPDQEIPVVQTGSTIGTHAGPGLVGVGGIMK